ncbi:hypothetical protein [Brevibacillus gelatini]
MKRVEIVVVLFCIGVIFLGLWLQYEVRQQMIITDSKPVSLQQDNTNLPVQQQVTSAEDFALIIKGAVFTYEGLSKEAHDLLLNQKITKEEKNEKYKAIMTDVADARNTVINMQLSDNLSKELAQKSSDMLFSLYHALNESKSLIELNDYYTRAEVKKPFEEAIRAKNKIISEHNSTAARLHEELKNSFLFQ